MYYFLSLILLLICIFFIYRFVKKTKYKKLETNLVQKYNVEKIRKVKNQAYDFHIEKDNEILLIKVIFGYKRAEIYLHNTKEWYYATPKNNFRPKLITKNKFYDLVGFKYPTKKVVRKIYLFYPASKISLYRDNSEIIFTNPLWKCFGIYIHNFI